MAPFTPFIAEEIYRNLTDGESVHLAQWPKVDANLIDEEGMKEMSFIRMVVTKVLQKRSEAKIKVRQPLASVKIGNPVSQEGAEIIKDEANVKAVIYEPSLYDVVGDEGVELDLAITLELKLEGEMREIIRALQEGRKQAGFNVEDRITVAYQGMERVFDVTEHQAEVAKEVLAEGGIRQGEMSDAEYTESTLIEGETFIFWLKRL
jgi:isoleucyl-tRNA synthetase